MINQTPTQRARWLAAALVRRTYAGGMGNSSEFGFDIDALLNLCAAVAQEAIERHEEEKAAPKLEELLGRLLDFHDRNETLAEGCDMPGSVKWHKGQREIISDAAKNGGAFISPQEAVATERERLAQRYQESARDLEDEAFERAPAALRRKLYLKLAGELLKDQTL